VKLVEFKELMLKAAKFAKKSNPDVYFIYGNTELDIKRIGQFSIMPDVYIYLRKEGKGKK
jgi:hypothetical protein